MKVMMPPWSSVAAHSMHLLQSWRREIGEVGANMTISVINELVWEGDNKLRVKVL